MSVSEAPEGDFDSSVFSGSVQQIAVGSEVNVAVDEDVSAFLVTLYSYNPTSTSEAFQLGDGRVMPSGADAEDSTEDVDDVFQKLLRETESTLALDDETRLGSRVRDSQIVRSVGDTETFKVLNSTSSTDDYETVTATLRYVGDGYDFYVDNRNEESLSDEDLAELAAGFAVDAEQAIFGEESDVDGDGRFAVVFTQAVNELGASGGGLVTGYFFAIDLYDDTFYSVSNEREVFFTTVPDPEGEVGTAISRSFAMTNLYPTVLPHEFQHMINFNERVFERGYSSESSWLNEAMSHLAEDLMSVDDNGDMVQTSIENYSRVYSYLSTVQNVCITCGTSLSQRGGAYLFLRYLYEQASLGNIAGFDDGTELIQALMYDRAAGITKVADVLAGADLLGPDITEVLGKWALAIYFSNTGATSDDHYAFTGIDLRAACQDNRGTVLNGPAIQNVNEVPFVNTLQGVSLTYLNVDVSVLTEGSLTISFEEDAEFGGYVVW